MNDVPLLIACDSFLVKDANDDIAGSDRLKA
jgi:hypothetical protein